MNKTTQEIMGWKHNYQLGGIVKISGNWYPLEEKIQNCVGDPPTLGVITGAFPEITYIGQLDIFVQDYIKPK